MIINPGFQVNQILVEKVGIRFPLTFFLPKPGWRALLRSARVARQTARIHGTPIYVWCGGKVVAEKP